MPVSVQHSPPPVHEPGETNKRPRGILKNPSFSAASADSGRGPSPDKPSELTSAQTAQLGPQEEKELTLQNTLQNAGHRRSSSSARRASTAARRHSASVGGPSEGSDEGRLKWDEANLYLAEQDRGSRMKITEPKTPYEYGRDLPPEDDEEEEEEDVSIDPKYVNVDEVDMQKNKAGGSKGPKRESEIPGLELGEPEEEFTAVPGTTNDDASRIVRGGSLSREGSQGSQGKHVSVSEDKVGEGTGVGLPSKEAMEKHRKFEERRKKHYEMKDVKGLLGHVEDEDDDMDDSAGPPSVSTLPNRGVNGTR